ncbi:hypothetical protein EEL30_22220 [Brevibacillus laterosporus]|uniref:Uncharacterized protein n=1 Tax=Brevibacillus laterosporus TaxID=1465 RepID=A0A518VCN1_BRELA|nr:hypothetical protein EEL30_22220 [Brevibacillus laterosporus]
MATNTPLLKLKEIRYEDDVDVLDITKNFQTVDDWLGRNVVERHADLYKDYVVEGLLPSTTTGVRIHDCDSVWDEIASPTGVSLQKDTVDFKSGVASLKINMLENASIGLLASTTIYPIDLTTTKTIKLWVKCNINTKEGDFALVLSDAPLAANHKKKLNFPSLIANTWTLVELPLGTNNQLKNIISVGTLMQVDKGACILWLDYINGVNLDTTISEGKAYVQGSRIVKTSMQRTFSSYRETYLFIDRKSNYIFKEVPVGSSQPTTPDESLLLAKVLTSSYEIIEVIDKRNLSAFEVSPTLADGQVTESKIASNAVTNSKIGNNSITSSKIFQDAVLNHHIKDQVVNNPKLRDADISLGTVSDGTKAGKLNAEYRSFTIGKYESNYYEEEVPHELNRIPKGYIIVRSDKPVRIYDGYSLWTDKKIFIRGDNPNTKVTIMIF